MFQFRKAAHEDFLIIATMPQNQEGLFYMYPKGKFPISSEILEGVASSRFSPTVITYMGEVAGYCNFYEVNKGHDCWLGNVIVHPNFRRKGVGAYLLETMKNIARIEYNARELKLVCYNINTKALLFYYKHGFKPFDMKEMEDFQSNKIIGIMMSTNLCE
ncbi:Ribosomal protein S18 acetylase RimI [Paenibacillus barengoltzii]|uniref:GNAT family N-acetyltransferase n=1 Tax=Paenibacillus barengoltzii TaxID=343517 RepID=UPI000A083A39|nr:GNAT family N-acetyltransferase [Paenibacillus barengoltzii]SMF68937.1 Ribosomal protein S18 acetylase RimI [Paenibacillus barengoltzii]